ncbi:uroporphyrinogen-III C-methyltransferase [Alcanivorax sp. S6407]|uniref:uroporphyrinogen-III C-methyltransferase n=1 Tax=Alcanivorax sp. S6407 TaxID=2926424 RepID=UPI001FF55E36|nr:uroporphyrinogen-III C-methyltransferase [Alcanivorax sp. S6407]MCK0153662.1 uroporphyrinogen-III C-methyltransferase [Alcanivorax sp. S6407]
MTQDRLSSRQTGMTRWLVLVILILACVIGAGGWLGWQEYLRLQADKADVVGQMEALQADMAAQRSEVQGALAGFEKKQAELAAQRVKDQAVLTDMKTGGQKLWLINEARALASLASQRLLLTQDALAARRLLEAADGVLTRIDDPSVLTARQALAVDMDKLSRAGKVDVQGMVLQLGALRQTVAELAVPVEEAPPERDTPEVSQPWWQDVLDRMPVTVRHHEGRVPLPLSAQQASLVRLTLDGSLQQAQLALMQGRGEAYEQALSNAEMTLKEWFRNDDPRASHMREVIEEMGGRQIAYTLPEIGAGLAAIEALKRKEGGA